MQVFSNYKKFKVERYFFPGKENLMVYISFVKCFLPIYPRPRKYTFGFGLTNATPQIVRACV